MTKIMSNSKGPAVTYRHDYATEAHNESEENPLWHHAIMTSW